MYTPEEGKGSDLNSKDRGHVNSYLYFADGKQ